MIDIAVTNGVLLTEFKPNDQNMREQVAKMISNYMKLDDTNHDKVKKYKDNNIISSLVLNSVERVIEQEYMNGYLDKII